MKSAGTAIRNMSWFVSSLLLVLGSVASAGDAGNAGICMADGHPISFNNEQVLQWKTSTPNSWKNRGHIQGVLLKAYPDHSGHHHFEVQIGASATDTIEIIYNEEFGPLPDLNVGTRIEACGDYITSKSQAGPYPPSPDGAIIHWVHAAPNPRHEDGFVIVNGTLCGQNTADAGSKDYPNRHGRHH